MNAVPSAGPTGAADPRDGESPIPRAPALPSASLFRGHREVVILHGGQEYRLRITRADKLILTK
jgi:hemin uptake protein HemP